MRTNFRGNGYSKNRLICKCARKPTNGITTLLSNSLSVEFKIYLTVYIPRGHLCHVLIFVSLVTILPLKKLFCMKRDLYSVLNSRNGVARSFKAFFIIRLSLEEAKIKSSLVTDHSREELQIVCLSSSVFNSFLHWIEPTSQSQSTLSSWSRRHFYTRIFYVRIRALTRYD